MGLNASRVKLKTIKVTINTNKSNSKYQESKRLIVMFKSLLSGLFAAAIKTVGAEKSTAFHKSRTYFITKLYPFTSHGHTLSQSCILSQVMDILYHKVVSFHKSWTYFITKLYPFTHHGHTLSQSCILSHVMDILYHKVVSFHKSWTYFITKLYPFTSHGHTLSQSWIKYTLLWTRSKLNFSLHR
jgi:hypothetical protein